jgi:hypothetical protein
MKKIMILAGLVMALSGMAGAEAPSGVVKTGEMTSTGYCDPLVRALGGCRSVEQLPTNY